MNNLAASVIQKMKILGNFKLSSDLIRSLRRLESDWSS